MDLNRGGFYFGEIGIVKMYNNFVNKLDECNWFFCCLFNLECNCDFGNLIVFYEFFLFKWGFKLVLLNINSFFVYIDELRILFFDRFIDILVINEIKLDDIISDNKIYIFGYEFICSDCFINGRFGEGVCFFICFEINYFVCFDLICEYIESLIVEIKKFRLRFFVVMIWYRFFDFLIDFFSLFEEFIGKFDLENIEYYILGDLNCNMVVFKFDNSINILFNIVEVYGFD